MQNSYGRLIKQKYKSKNKSKSKSKSKKDILPKAEYMSLIDKQMFSTMVLCYQMFSNQKDKDKNLFYLNLIIRKNI